MVSPAEPPLRAELEAAGAHIHIVPMMRISGSYSTSDWVRFALRWPRAIVRIRHLIRSQRIDLVHTNSMHSWYGWAAARLTGRPHIWHAREIVTQSRTALRVERFLMARFATRVIAMSHAIADQLDPKNVEVIYERADPQRFGPEHAGRFRQTVQLPDDAPLALMVGRLDTWKGFEVALAAWPQVAAAHPTARLAIVGVEVRGKEHFAAELRATAAPLPGVHFLGARTEMPEIYADADVTLVPSTDPEPYGLVVVEALASGVPVIATDHGGPPEILRETIPHSGVTVAPRDADALAQAIVATFPATTSTEARRARPPRSTLPEPPFARTFAEVAQARSGEFPLRR